MSPHVHYHNQKHEYTVESLVSAGDRDTGLQLQLVTGLTIKIFLFFYFISIHNPFANSIIIFMALFVHSSAIKPIKRKRAQGDDFIKEVPVKPQTLENYAEGVTEIRHFCLFQVSV